MWDDKLQEAYKIIESEENNQRGLWRISSEVKAQYGAKGLREFSINLKDNFGIGKSYNTLRHYAHIFDAIKQYNIPVDITYPAIRAVVSSGDIPKWVTKINEGASSEEIIRLIHLEKPQKQSKMRCPVCKTTIDCPTCQKNAQ